MVLCTTKISKLVTCWGLWFGWATRPGCLIRSLQSQQVQEFRLAVHWKTSKENRTVANGFKSQVKGPIYQKRLKTSVLTYCQTKKPRSKYPNRGQHFQCSMCEILAQCKPAAISKDTSCLRNSNQHSEFGLHCVQLWSEALSTSRLCKDLHKCMWQEYSVNK